MIRHALLRFSADLYKAVLTATALVWMLSADFNDPRILEEPNIFGSKDTPDADC
jgi:hypothetical protein